MAAALSQCAASGNRFLIADVKTDAGKSVVENAAVFRSIMEQQQPDALKYGAAYFPYLQTNIPYRFKEAAVAVSDQRTGTTITTTLVAVKTTDTVLYGQLLAALKNFCAVLPPSAVVAGIYTAVDNSRGVWKAPANVSLSNVNGVTVPITDVESGTLNIDVTGISINALRTFAGKGILVWGARTLDGNSQEWRYVSVRRFISTVQNSVKLALGAFAFEHNSSNTWTTVKSMLSNYLTQLWRQGALMGAKPGAAFFVNIGLGITMTQADVDNGLLIVQTGLAVLRPAEFIIITIVQKIQPV